MAATKTVSKPAKTTIIRQVKAKATLATSQEFKALRAETKRLLQNQEGLEVDFKEQHHGVKAEDFVAFANTVGGTILVGVREVRADDGRQTGIIIGCPISDEIRQGFINRAASCRPAIGITVSVENIGSNKPIYRIDVPEGPHKPYCTSNGLYMFRAEGQRIGIDPTRMRAIILERETEEFVARFKAAGDALLERISQVHDELSQQIERVENIVRDAEAAASRAADIAEQAQWAAEAAQEAAENAGDQW